MRFTICDLGFTNDNLTGTVIGTEDIVDQKSKIINHKTRNGEL